MPAIVPTDVPVWLVAAGVSLAGEVDCDVVDADAAGAVGDAVDKLVMVPVAIAEEDVVVTVVATALLILK